VSVVRSMQVAFHILDADRNIVVARAAARLPTHIHLTLSTDLCPLGRHGEIDKYMALKSCARDPVGSLFYRRPIVSNSDSLDVGRGAPGIRAVLFEVRAQIVFEVSAHFLDGSARRAAEFEMSPPESEHALKELLKTERGNPDGLTAV
jgi:hypothetical protein